MKKTFIVNLLVFSGLWGFSEAFIGDLLYTHSVPAAGLILSIIAFVILCISRNFILFQGSAVLIASVAMLYKFLNEPFYPCHLLGIFMLGLGYDIFFSLYWPRRKLLAPAASAYFSYAAFALLITYVFRYSHWVEKGLTGVLQYILLHGTVCAVIFSLSAPRLCALGGHLQNMTSNKHFEKISPAIYTACISLLWGILIPSILSGLINGQ